MLDIPQYSVNWCGSARQARCINSYDEGFYFISDELLAPHKYGGGGGAGVEDFTFQILVKNNKVYLYTD